jgi:hypothetical protein
MAMRAAIALGLATVLTQATAHAQQQPPPADAPPGTPPPADAPPASPPPPAQPPAQRQQLQAPAGAVAAGVPGYCQYIEGVADAEGALLIAPEIFGAAGMINVGQAEGGDGVALGAPRGRLMLGLEWDLIEIWRGFDVHSRADALCRRYRAQSALEIAVRAGPDVGSAPALAARAKVLAEALPAAEALVDALHGDVREARATVDELDVVRLRLDELRSEARNVVLAQQRMEALPYRNGGALTQVLADYRKADDEVEEIEGGLRSLDAWSFELRGGIDEVLGVEQDVPLFGLATLTFDIGGLWVPSANSRAREGRKRWVAEDVMGPDRRIAELVSQLRSVRDAERARLKEVALLAEDLGVQLREVRSLGTSHVRRYESFLFFELVRLQGEKAYLEAHLEEIDRIMGNVEP